METPASTPTPMPLPDHLPSPWEQPEDEQQFWHSDPMHFPYPSTMIDDVFMRTVYGPGLNHGFSTYHVPLRVNSRRFWAHHFHAMSPLMLPEEEIEAMGKQSEEKLGATMGRLMEHWETGWLPEIKQLLGEWERFDLQAASIPELLVHLDATVQRIERVWSLHFEIVLPSQLPISLFDEFYRDLFEDENPFAAYRLLQGFDNMTLRAGSELWTLSRKARESPDVRTVLEEKAASDVISALRASDDGRAFLEELRLYLEEFGQRGSMWGVSPTSWIEDPTPVVNTLKDYITRTDGDPNFNLEGMAAEREQLVGEARDRLQSYPEAVREKFESLLVAAQAGNLVAEEHGYWIDFRATYQFRRVFMEFGRRFAEAGVIERADDIFHLTLHEIRETAGQLPHGDRRDLVETRKAEIARFVDVQLPPAIGTPPPGPPPVNPMTQALGKFFGTPPQPSTDPDVLNGAAGSPGVVRGTARIIRTLNEAGRLQAGDILVTATTAPPWTPLFATVAAVVTDHGGILSHCAVVAREYRIPAVVGVGVATTAIQDGQEIEVDGNRGVVRILDRAPVSHDVADSSTPVPIPTPDDFPVAWPNPEDARAFWLLERMHWPDPMPPMDFEFMRDAHDQFSWAFANYGVPLQYNPRHINYRWYFSVTPSIADHSEIPARMQAGLQNLEATIPRLRDLWNDEWLPEVLDHLAYWRTFDLAGATMPELLAHHDETVARFTRVWQIHFLQTFPVYMAMSTFDDLYQDLFGEENTLDAYRLMQGFDNNTVELGRELWRLSRKVLASPALRATFENPIAVEVIPALELSDEGRLFLEDLRAFLDTYGRRGEKVGVSFVSWLEDPTPAIRHIQEYALQPDLDVDAQASALIADRESLLAEARATLKGFPQPVVEKFEAMLAYAQHATVISEDHTLYIDFGSIHEVRQVMLEFGHRFAAAGVLDNAGDIFMLTRAELCETAERLPDVSQRETVAQRQAEMKHFGAVVAPPALGTPQADHPPEDPLSRTIGKFFGAPPSEPDVSQDDIVLRGGSGSRGRATGVARVIASLADAHRLKHGDILVTATTAPAWTPLFSVAAAVVTDTGGILSHCAVVAREYGIPAVVGVGMATMMIADGQMIEVDGDRGTVRILQGN